MNPLSKLDKDQLREIFRNSNDGILNQIADKLYELDVDGDNLVNLTKDDYKELGLTFGQRKKLIRVIAAPLEFVNFGLEDKQEDKQEDTSPTNSQSKSRSPPPELLKLKPPEQPLSTTLQLKPPPPGPPIPPQSVGKAWQGDGVSSEDHTIPVYTPRLGPLSPPKKVDKTSPLFGKPISPKKPTLILEKPSPKKLSPVLEEPNSPEKAEQILIIEKSSPSKKVDSILQIPNTSNHTKNEDSKIENLGEEKREKPRKRAREDDHTDEHQSKVKSKRRIVSIPTVSSESGNVDDTWSKLREKVTEYATNQGLELSDPHSAKEHSSSPNLTLSPPVETSTAESANTTHTNQKSKQTNKPTQQTPSAGVNQQSLATSTVIATVPNPPTITAAQYGLTESFVWDPKHRHFFEASTARVYKPEHPQVGNFWDVENKIYLKVHPQQYKLITAHYAVDSDIKQQLPDTQSVQAGYYQGYAYPQSGYAYGSVYPYSPYGYNDTVNSAAYGEAISQFYDQANLVFQSNTSQTRTITYEDNTAQTTAEDYFQQKTIVEQQAAEYQKLIARQRQAEYEKQLEMQKKSKTPVPQVVAKPTAPAPTEAPRPKRRRTSRFSAGPAKVVGLGKFEVISQGK